MQIVIDIDEDRCNGIINNEIYAPLDICVALANGTPLPKHHGRLIDADAIALIDEQFYVSSDYYVAESAIDNAPTIIEAERGTE